VPKKIGAAKHREARTLGEAVGTELTRLRIARGWSQQKLADELGYTERYIGQLERGTKSPTLRTIADIAEVFRQGPPRFSGLPSGDIEPPQERRRFS
jgi:transcriptional regulator with XRE-family HTH domain